MHRADVKDRFHIRAGLSCKPKKAALTAAHTTPRREQRLAHFLSEIEPTPEADIWEVFCPGASFTAPKSPTPVKFWTIKEWTALLDGDDADVHAKWSRSADWTCSALQDNLPASPSAQARVFASCTSLATLISKDGPPATDGCANDAFERRKTFESSQGLSPSQWRMVRSNFRSSWCVSRHSMLGRANCSPRVLTGRPCSAQITGRSAPEEHAGMV